MKQPRLLTLLCTNFPLLTRLKSLLTVIVVSVVVSACASSGGTSDFGGGVSGNSSRVSICKAGDQQVQSSSQCLQDDAACYQLSNNQWCTGERGNICPAGSSELPAGMSCPRGKRCFNVGESLRCTIS